ncbi:GDSL-type esterase/lipase family protein [Lysinibacillus sp. SGAir0095]|uniref:GDSL-type esterase/lipase family protein n=1 Tax=Lysinibacillus sp. SGAir0095 TaxID=2070463 RepID=UPI0010CD545C|nr:GDSL-type esterase/lipase family protein [Lysinibacillus sp. SGAir0095]QCR32396.1 lysophospholipase [Lysinibacillus sp. SGAir0095]
MKLVKEKQENDLAMHAIKIESIEVSEAIEATDSEEEIAERAEKEQKETESVHPVEDSKESFDEELTLTTAFQESIEEQLLNELQLVPPEEIKADTSKLYYLALGDSLTRGIGDEEQKNGYTKRLVEKIVQSTDVSEVILDNRGKRGRRSDQLLDLVKKGHYDYELKNAELITLTIGGNDIMKVVKKDLFELKREVFDKELEEFKKRYNQILAEIRVENPEVPIIVVGLYNPFSVITDEITEFESIITEWNDTIETTSSKYQNACFVDIQDLFDENANLVYHSDFFHPNGYGYTIMTERIISMMKACHIEDSTSGLIFSD